MSDIKKESDSAKKPPSKLTLKSRVEVSSVQQSSRKSGGGNTVKVEVRKKRSFSRNSDGKMVADGRVSPSTTETKNISTKGDDKTLTSQEREQRLKALQQAEVDQVEEQKIAEEKSKLQEQERLAIEIEELKQKAEQERYAKTETVEKDTSGSADKKNIAPATSSDAKTKPANEVKQGDKTVTSSTKEAASNGSGKTLSLKSDSKDSTSKVKPKKKGEVSPVNKKAPAKGKKSLADTGKRKNKLTVQNAFNDDIRERSLASLERARKKAKRQLAGNSGGDQVKIVREVIVPEVITVSELANRMATRTTDVIRELMKMGSMLKSSDNIDFDTAELIVEEFGHTIKKVQASDIEDILRDDRDFEEDRISRAPVVTIMGHVDHGKTSLLDALRNTDVVAGEAGGITQHIGAYKVHLKDGNEITFLDTPGHEAFTAMRMRGANITDLVILVVAADDGIMEQTIEAINHARAASVPIIVAINKIDKPDADPSRVLNELLQHEIVAESFGGDVMTVEVSAKEKLGLEALEEAILLQSEVLELKASRKCFASGIVVESSVDKNRGVVATLLVQKGTLSVGDIAIAGSSVGRVRAMRDDKGRPLQSAGPADPVEVLGLDCAPEAGEIFNYVDNDKTARNIAEYRLKLRKELGSAAASKTTLSELLSRAAGTGVKELCIIIKGDVQGSIEAIATSLTKMNTEEVAVKVVHSAVGGITESDVNLARASNAFIVGFNVRANTAAKTLSETEGVNLRYYSIIYDLINDVKTVLSGMLDPAIKEKHLGNAVIRQVFNITKSGKIAGCYVTDGTIKRGSGVRLLRDNVVIHEGKLKTLKRFKDEVPEVNKNFECGMAFESYENIKENDIIEAFEMIEEAREL